MVLGRPAGRRPAVVDLVREEVPGKDGQLAGDGDDRDRVTAPGGDPSVEAMEWTRPSGGAQGGLHEEAPDVALAGMADVAGVGRSGARLADDRVEPEIADELVRSREAPNVPDEGDQAGRRLEPDAGDRQQTPDSE